MKISDVNEAHIVGRAGRDAEIKYTSTGKTVAKFSIATGGGKKKDGSQYPADFHRCQAWGDNLAQQAMQIKKGAAVEVFGAIRYGSYEKNGQTVYTTDIVCKSIGFPNAEADLSQDKPEPVDSTEITDEDIPF